ncbi:MAG: diguanylate cyclase [Candidatus Glassbacteria bacterium]|nr:diguanylate cyclase [Candidatus Glassbacteria bacterium]
MKKNQIILVVEDDKSLNSLYCECLLNNGYRVDPALTGKEALKKVKSHSYDMALIDIRLPDANGMDVLKQIKQISEDTVTIMLSGHATVELILDAISHGVFDFLVKPVQLAKLLLTVDNGLEQREINLQNQKLISELKIAKRNLEAGIRERTKQVKKSELKFRSLYDNAPDVYYTVDQRGRIIDCNKMATQFFGITKKELNSRHLLDLYTSDNFELVSSMVPTPDGKGGSIRHQEVSVKKADGTIACVEINSNILHDGDGKVIGALTIQRDITSRKHAEGQLRESEERFRTIFQTADVALVELDYDPLTDALERVRKSGIKSWKKYFDENPDFVKLAGELIQTVDVNHAAVKLFEAERREDLLGPFKTLFSDLESDNFKKFLATIARGEKNFQGESDFLTIKQNHLRMILNVAVPRKGAKFKNLLVSLVDITARSRVEKEKDLLLNKLHQLNNQLETLAVTDGLTSLYNHRFLMESINREFSRAQRHGRPLALLMADIDDFKNFNDSYGHQLGDEVLVAVADLLRRGRRGTDIVARYGGEEFVLLLPDTTLRQAMSVGDNVRKKVERNKVMADQGPLNVTISLGVFAMEKNNLDNPKDLLILADKALYRAKRAGKNQVCTVKADAK